MMKQPVRQQCGMYLRRGVIYVRTISGVHRGPYQDDGPCGRIANLEDFQLIGSTAVRFARQSREGIENVMIENLNEATRVWLEAADVSSWSTFVKSARYVGLSIQDQIEISPYHNGGLNGKGRGYHSLSEKEIRLPLNSSHEEIGKEIMEAFKLCTGLP